MNQSTSGNFTIQFDQFPGSVKVIDITGADARTLADLGLHLSDLKFALESLEAINHPGVTEHIQQSLWRSAISHFFKCFQQSKSRALLDPAKVFAGTPPEAIINFEYFKNLRNKTLIHDENAFTQVAVVAFINDGSKPYKIEALRTMVLSFGTLDQTAYSNFHTTVSRAFAWVQDAYNALEANLVRSLETEPYDALVAMPEPTNRVPLWSEAGLTRPRKF